MDVALGGLRENSICTFAVCSARYKTRPGLVYHYGHSHSTSSGDLAKELSPSPADVESRSTADAAVSDQSGWSLKISSIFSLTPEPELHFPHTPKNITTFCPRFFQGLLQKSMKQNYFKSSNNVKKTFPNELINSFSNPIYYKSFIFQIAFPSSKPKLY